MNAVPGSIFHIDGAIVYSEMQETEISGETGWKIPTVPNPAYQYGTINPNDGFPLASTDGKKWVIALVYLIDGKTVGGPDLGPLRWSYV